MSSGEGVVGSERRAVAALGALALVAGLAGVAAAAAGGVGFAEAGRGARVFAFHHANGAGGLVIAACGVAALAAAATARRWPASAAGLGLLAAGVAVAAGQATGANVLGGTGSTLAVCLGLGGGLLACGLTPGWER